MQLTKGDSLEAKAWQELPALNGEVGFTGPSIHVCPCTAADASRFVVREECSHQSRAAGLPAVPLYQAGHPGPAQVGAT